MLGIQQSWSGQKDADDFPVMLKPL